MGRRYKNKEPFIIEFVETIATIPYGYVIGLVITVICLGISELLIPWHFGEVSGEMGKQMLIHVAPAFQWFFRIIAGLSLLAAISNFWIK
jgi:hypothetical protein